MIGLHDIRYVRLGTRDLDAASRYATRILGLEPAGSVAGARYFRSDARDHTLVYTDADPADHTVGFELRRRRGTRRGRHADRSARAPGAPRDARRMRAAPRRGVRALHRSERQPRRAGRRRTSLRSGVHAPRAKPASPGSRTSGLRTTDAARDEAFWTRVCNARVSDRIGAAPLLRIDAVHHTHRAVPVDARRRAARQSPGREHRRHHARVVFPAREGRAGSCSGRGGTQRRRRSSSITKDRTAWCTSTRPVCARSTTKRRTSRASSRSRRARSACGARARTSRSFATADRRQRRTPGASTGRPCARHAR